MRTEQALTLRTNVPGVQGPSSWRQQLLPDTAITVHPRIAEACAGRPGSTEGQLIRRADPAENKTIARHADRDYPKMQRTDAG